MKYKIFDTHAHYDSDSFDEDRENVIKELKENGVIGVLNCGSDLYGLRKSVELAKEFDMFYAAVGIHPENADEFNEDVVKEIKEFVKNEKVKAIGEIGLDYYWEENPPREVQKEVFRAQMKLADELNLPVVIHDRDAHKDTLEIMKEFPHVIGVVHCFSGSVEFAKECIKLGYYIGFTGVLTFKNAKKLVDVCREIPAERMLVETDCPFMAPVPFRGKRNKSDYIEYIIDKMSEIRGISGEEMNEVLLNNKKRLFKI
ncbi:TatD family hydrolase [Clostridium perfringens]|uniref:TatD family hydrolase n=2 Tax=Clostridium perfringens TaxID=1502 RepID=A0A2X2Y6U3_CLOPF|nr:TatD family hydrolase [Clostridium perfringens]ABG85812.1 hydrolase, TatD family [Clostridium perfringens SM101]AXH53714.1 TatD family deoxyribonuclease [Clostridium perfringens]EDS80651.1 hydrolase, TatD family [Clostridium perfringens C str. JGS1495]EJT5924921.1 TatD family hydrolase [Clostridium perfringens]ELC8420995.1 TatD family hydrolase [Clostridium perfringens]